VSYTSIVFFLLLCSSLAWGKSNIQSGLIVSTAWLEAHLGDPGVVIVHVEDATDPDHYAEGHIPDAHFVLKEHLGIIRRGIDGMLPTLDSLIELARGLGISERTKKVVIYGPEHPFGAARLFHALDYLGLRDVLALLDGHFPKWKEEGRPTTEVVPDPTYSDFVPTVNPRALIERGAVGDLMSALALRRMADPTLDGKGVVLFDSRYDDTYGAGHIPGAVQAFSVLNFEGWWNGFADPRTRWVLVSRKEIVDRFEALGLGRKGDLAITSCTTGLAGALLYHTLAYAGFDVTLYDGSFNEWSTIAISDNDDDELKIWRSVYPGYAGQADGRLPVVTGLERWLPVVKDLERW
jgi:thiosulfate/3-mercaptopyruvate sulfurtransferase